MSGSSGNRGRCVRAGRTGRGRSCTRAARRSVPPASIRSSPAGQEPLDRRGRRAARGAARRTPDPRSRPPALLDVVPARVDATDDPEPVGVAPVRVDRVARCRSRRWPAPPTSAPCTPCASISRASPRSSPWATAPGSARPCRRARVGVDAPDPTGGGRVLGEGGPGRRRCPCHLYRRRRESDAIREFGYRARMKVARIAWQGATVHGIVDAEAGTVAPLEASVDLFAALRGEGRPGAPVPLDEVRLLAPLEPPSFRDFITFEEHIEGPSLARGGSPTRGTRSRRSTSRASLR